MKNNSIVIGISIFVAVIVIVAAIYFFKADSGISGNVVETQEPLKINVGVLIPMTGPRSDGGEYCRRGLELALEEINLPSNIEKKKYLIHLNYEDTQYDAKTAVSAIHNLISLKSNKYVVGPYSSPETLAVAPVVQENNVLLITPTAQASEISNSGDNIFRTQISVNQEAPYWAEFIKQEFSVKKLSIIAINNDYGVSYIDAFTKAYPPEDIVAIHYYDPKETDFRTYLIKIQNTKTTDILVLATPKNTGTILKQLGELNMDLNVYASSPVEAKELLSIAQESADGLMFPSPYDETSDLYSMKEYRTKYYEKYSQVPEMISANCYDSLKIFALCFDKYGDDVELVKRCIYEIQGYRGASGILSFDENGDVYKDLIIKKVVNGNFVKYYEE
ncbi:MAG: ABC transporter substrate-binding protein [Candidatus Woesearchaeota archaeon]